MNPEGLEFALVLFFPLLLLPHFSTFFQPKNLDIYCEGNQPPWHYQCPTTQSRTRLVEFQSHASNVSEETIIGFERRQKKLLFSDVKPSQSFADLRVVTLFVLHVTFEAAHSNSFLAVREE